MKLEWGWQQLLLNVEIWFMEWANHLAAKD
jgi:hypothetical protein